MDENDKNAIYKILQDIHSEFEYFNKQLKSVVDVMEYIKTYYFEEEIWGKSIFELQDLNKKLENLNATISNFKD